MLNRWEYGGRFEWADTREAAAVLFGADPAEVQFAGFSHVSPVRPVANRLRLVRWVAAREIRA